MLLDKRIDEVVEFESKVANLQNSFSSLPQYEYEALLVEVDKIKSSECWKLEQKLLKSRRDGQSLAYFPENPEKYVFNLTDRTLSEKQFEVLSLGPRFCIPACKYNRLEEEANMEAFFHQLDSGDHIFPEKRGFLRSDLVSAFHQYTKVSPQSNLITKGHLEALSQSKGDTDY